MGKKYGLSLVLVMLLAFWLSLGTSLGAAADDFQLTILHTSENHGHWEPMTIASVSQGGIARRATLVKSLRSQIPNTLLLDSGDISQGTLYFVQHKGAEGRDFYNLLGYDAVVPGNHEFDLGPAVLADNFLNGATFSAVLANVDVSREPALAGKLPPFVIKTVGGEKVGIFGLVTDELPVISSAGPNVAMKDTTQAARDVVVELGRQGVDKVILLSHLGFPADLELAGQVDGIDVIVSGHTETLLGDPNRLDPSLGKPVGDYPTVASGPNGGRTLIVHAFTWGRLLGRLDLTFNGQGEVVAWEGHPIFVDEKTAEDPEAAQELAEVAGPLDELKKQVVGETAVDLDGQRTTVRNQESNLGNLIADATLWSTRQDNTQIALMNGGGIRASIQAGSISYAQVLDTLPFGNRLVQFDVSGADLLAALENGLSRLEANPGDSAGRFLQVGGLKFSADLSQPAGQRVHDVQVGTEGGGFEPLDRTATYRIVANDFLRSGGDGFSMFLPARNVRGGDVPLDLALVDYLKANSPVSPQVAGRILLAGALVPAPAPQPEVPSTLPRTGDGLVVMAMPLLAIALTSMATGIAIRRRR